MPADWYNMRDDKPWRMHLCSNADRIIDSILHLSLIHIEVAERAGISRNTLTKIERGEEGVAMGYYFRVLAILGLEKDLLLVAKDDELGRALQDAKLVVGERVSKKR